MAPGNAVAALALTELGHLFGETRYLDSANRTIDWARGLMEQLPAGHCSMLTALEAAQQPPEQIIVRGPRKEMDAWLAAARIGYQPRRRVYGIPYADDIRKVPPFLPRLVSADFSAKPVAYRCDGFSCSPPIESLADFRTALADPDG
ncbi:MAG: hypothetical protein U5Q16_03315 [Gammaproteobacteria bacterium]|nr:hypothetical protein [Gammaproteobacteria bacterium]